MYYQLLWNIPFKRRVKEQICFDVGDGEEVAIVFSTKNSISLHLNSQRSKEELSVVFRVQYGLPPNQFSHLQEKAACVLSGH